MFRSHPFAKLSTLKTPKSPMELGQAQSVLQKPMFLKMSQIVLQAPHLRTADAAAYRKYMMDNEPFVDVAEVAKSCKRAGQLRQEGNRLYLAKKYDAALEKYNESICFAENGSEDLGIGYANRSALYYEIGEFEFALANIALAKKNHYPEKLMPKLVARELICKQKIDQGLSNGIVPCPRMGFNVECNSKIPVLAKGIAMKNFPEFGRGLVAEKAFRAGDVLLSEKPLAATIDPSLKYLDCAHCSIVHFSSLIPCQGCVSFMYCSEECLEQDKKTHRFECGLAEKIQYISCINLLLGPRMFFYGLSLFNDDLKEMMAYCQSHGQTGGNPLELDYVSYDPLEEFKVFHRTKSQAHKFPSSEFLKVHTIFEYFSAAYYSVFIRHPPVAALVRTKHDQDFMLQSFVHYMRTTSYLSFDQWDCYASPLGLIATIANHSCDPNTIATIHSGRIKFVALRPIKEDEQICFSYGPLWYELAELKRIQTEAFVFDCRCVVCDPAKSKRWRASKKSLPPAAIGQWEMTLLVLIQPAVNKAAHLNAVKQYIERYAECHPHEKLSPSLKLYRDLLTSAIMDELAALQRAEAVKGLL